jgi:L1 cell adhesion molecule like protein
MRSLFSQKTVLRTDVEPDEAISLGCAIQAGLLNSSNVEYPTIVDNKDVLHAKALSKSIGIELADGTMEILLKKKSPLPVQRKIIAKCNPGQDVYVAVYEGENEIAKSNDLLAEAVLGEVKTDEVNICFTIEMDGNLSIVAKDKDGNQVKAKVLHH